MVAAGLGLAAALAGCAASVAPPDVSLLQGRVVGGGLLNQQLQVTLCVVNPNPREIALSKVTFQIAVEGDVLAKGVSETPLVLPPLGAVRVLFDVTTTTRDLGAPVAAIFTKGSLGYVVSGTVVLRAFTLIGLPYSIQGQVTPAVVAGELLNFTTSHPTRPPCELLALPTTQDNAPDIVSPAS